MNPLFFIHGVSNCKKGRGFDKNQIRMSKKQNLITDILQVAKNGDCVMDGDLFFSLAFRTESELIKIAQELNIKI